MAYEAKTKPTETSVADFIAAVDNPTRRRTADDVGAVDHRFRAVSLPV